MLLDILNVEDYPIFTKRLEEYGLIVDNSGRIGTSEITLKGANTSDVEGLGKLISDIYHRKNSSINKDIIKHLTFNKRCFTFD